MVYLLNLCHHTEYVINMESTNKGQVNMTMHTKGGCYKTFLTDRNSGDDKSCTDKGSVTQKKTGVGRELTNTVLICSNNIL
jgi:hypothetical protein